MISYYALKLLAYLGLYKITPTEYDNRLSQHPRVIKRGLFVSALTELSDYEAVYGYFAV